MVHDDDDDDDDDNDDDNNIEWSLFAFDQYSSTLHVITSETVTLSLCLSGCAFSQLYAPWS
jgi:hypothetical protein